MDRHTVEQNTEVTQELDGPHDRCLGSKHVNERIVSADLSAIQLNELDNNVLATTSVLAAVPLSFAAVQY